MAKRFHQIIKGLVIEKGIGTIEFSKVFDLLMISVFLPHKNIPYPKFGLLRKKKNIIETVFSQLKNWGLVNTKIRSYCGWILNALSTLATYVIQPFKPRVRIQKNLLIRN